jgi:sugar (pentulose or hexulose) kinase
LRAYLESCAFAVRAARRWIDDVVGADEGALTVAGGMARSSLFCRILASVSRREVVVGPPEASARGAAACAAIAAGLARDAGDLAWRGGDRCVPDEDDADAYDDAFERWLEREEQLEDF